MLMGSALGSPWASLSIPRAFQFFKIKVGCINTLVSKDILSFRLKKSSLFGLFQIFSLIFYILFIYQIY